MIKYKIKKRDLVKIISGKDVGKTGSVLSIDKKKGRILIEGLNLKKKAMRKSRKDQTGGIKEIEGYMNISNIMLVCPKCKKPTRIGFVVNAKDKKKNRICRKCKGEI
jgi:large subunit ribosomal protein L24